MSNAIKLVEKYFHNNKQLDNSEYFQIPGKKHRKKDYHRVLTNWKNFPSFRSISNGNDLIVIDDIEYLIEIQLTKVGNYNKIYFWSGIESDRRKAKNMQNVKVFDKLQDLSSDSSIDWSKAHIGGNMAFSITHFVIDLFSKKKPSKIQNISGKDWTVALKNTNSWQHNQPLEDKEKLLGLGLKKIIHLPYRYFKQIQDGKIDQAQVASVYFETEYGYNGDIEVIDMKSGMSYQAKRDSTVFPRDEFSYKFAHMPLVKNSLIECGVYHKGNEVDQNLVKGKELITIPHRAGGKGSKADSITGLRSVLQHCKSLNQAPTSLLQAQQMNLFDIFVYGFDSKIEKDSWLSLCNLEIFTRLEQDLSFKVEKCSWPVLQTLFRIPLDRIWTEKDLKDYVEINN